MTNLNVLTEFEVSMDTSFVRCAKDRNLSEHFDLSSLAVQLNMTYARLEQILQEFVDFECWNYALSGPKIAQNAAQGWTSLVLLTLMLATLWKLRRTLSTCTLIYHAATAIFEYPIAVNGIAVGHLWYHAEEPFYNRVWAFAVWRHLLASGWTIGDAFKLALSCLTFFLCLERFMGICFPIPFRIINRPRVAMGAIFASLIVGSAHLWYPMNLNLARTIDGLYVLRRQRSRSRIAAGWWAFLIQFVAHARIVFCLGIIVLSVATVYGLRNRATKVSSRRRSSTSSCQPRQFETQRRMTIRITRLSLITAACVLIDHVPWIVGRFLGIAWNRGNSTLKTILVGHSYEEIESTAYHLRVLLGVYHWAVWSAWFLHGIRFLVYLAFNRSMRKAFVQMVRQMVTVCRNGSYQYRHQFAEYQLFERIPPTTGAPVDHNTAEL